MKNIKSISIKKGLVESVISFMNVPLSASESRARNRVVTILVKELTDIDKERDSLLKQYSNKDEKGNFKTIENGTKYDITPENLSLVNIEMGKLLNEDFVIDVLPSNLEDLKVAYKAIKKTEKEMNISEGILYEELLKKFEVVNEK
ncbi:hypothetical protein [Methanoculleus sp.]|jgi:hypothetical protein|uniref:hypothetical protein n=1 Tax=Methanoculleus sp. TaxID=90427 RepID=UPI002600DCE0|nr:hypothetical protein [Methanoculleus sp.]MCK9319377.1 hypothetical protein [Methanoculleus sp.]